jgi:hypothetical protein
LHVTGPLDPAVEAVLEGLAGLSVHCVQEDDLSTPVQSDEFVTASQHKQSSKATLQFVKKKFLALKSAQIRNIDIPPQGIRIPDDR